MIRPLQALLEKRDARRFERELPFALRSAAALLQARVPFERVLQNLSNSGGIAGKEFSAVTLAIAHGSSVQEALQKLPRRIRSRYAGRAAGELAFCYRQGSNAEGLRRLADEIALAQRAAAKSTASKQALVGLAFITLSCIVPALFAAYASIGSSFLEASITPGTALAALAVAFPALDALLLAALSLLKEW